MTDERKRWNREIEALEIHLAPLLAGRILATQQAVDGLAAMHREIVDSTDIDLEAQTRWVAVLEVTARCIAIADSLVDQLKSGYAGETYGAARVLHEALDLAIALASGADDEVRRWLRGRQYPTQKAKSERTAFFARLADEYAEAIEKRLQDDPAIRQHIDGLDELGISLEKGLAGALHSIAGRTYGELSSGAHNRRGSISDSVSIGLRRFSYGPHPDPRVRARYIELVEGLIEQAILDVAAALAEVVGFDAVGGRGQALLVDLHRARQQFDFSAIPSTR